MNEQQLREMEARAQRATPGPWDEPDCDVALEGTFWWVFPESDQYDVTMLGDSNPRAAADAEFIAHARSDVPELIAEVRRLQEALAIEAMATDARLTAPPY